MPSIFNKLHHVCIVVHDLPATVAYYESLGVGPWKDFPAFTDFVQLDMPSVEGFHQSVYKYCDLDNFQLQLCSPGPGTPQEQFLLTNGEGVFHLGFEVADLASTDDAAQSVGLEAFMHGQRADGSGFSYFSTPKAGVTLQVRQTKN